MSKEVIKVVDSLADVRKVSKAVSINGKLVNSTVRSVAPVVTREGRKGIAVDCSRSKDGEISFVTVRYVDCAPGDIVGSRCIAEGEQRQHYPSDLTITEIPLSAVEEIENPSEVVTNE